MVVRVAFSVFCCFAFALVACADPLAGVTVEALVTSDDGTTFSLGDRTLRTVEDLRTGKGSRFDVRGGVVIDAQVMLKAIEDVTTYDTLTEATRSGGSSNVNPRMHQEGDRYVADDYETLFYFTLFANFERAIDFADGLDDDSDATQAKADVAFFPRVNASALFPLPIISSDNAAYAPAYDGWLALPPVIQAGVPFAMSDAVIAHEFGHRFFFQNVWRPGGSDDTLRDWATINGTNPLLNGLDEGLADVFAAAVMRSAQAVPAAFASGGAFSDDNAFLDEAQRRSFDGAFAQQATYDNLADLSLDATMLESCNITAADFSSDFNFYCVGTVVAATMWAAANEDANDLADTWMPIIREAMPVLGSSMVELGRFDMNMWVEATAQSAARAGVGARFCAAANARFASLIEAELVPSCL
jgi:hypothetical protein